MRLASGPAIALAHSNGISISTLPAAAPSFQLPGELDKSKISFQDFDADGNPAAAGVDSAGKLVCARFLSGAWQNCPNTPDSGVSAASVGRVFVGDFDGNKRLDVLVLADVTQPDKARGLVFRGTSDGYQPGNNFFPQSVKLASAADFYTVRFVDLNGDGLADILVLGDSRAGRKATSYINTASGWTEEPKYELPIDFGENAVLPQALQLLDFTGDGAPDALVCVAGWNNAANCHVLTNVCPQFPGAGVTKCFADTEFSDRMAPRAVGTEKDPAEQLRTAFYKNIPKDRCFKFGGNSRPRRAGDAAKGTTIDVESTSYSVKTLLKSADG